VDNRDGLRFLCAAIDVVWSARENGNHPSGALLVDREVYEGFWR
jgi:hypothetical protein